MYFVMKLSSLNVCTTYIILSVLSNEFLYTLRADGMPQVSPDNYTPTMLQFKNNLVDSLSLTQILITAKTHNYA